MPPTLLVYLTNIHGILKVNYIIADVNSIYQYIQTKAPNLGAFVWRQGLFFGSFFSAFCLFWVDISQ
jgi:hypothetical protein